ncbi:diguanylate cyclase [Mesoterricola sediminis]|uniref:diguanylate cyclase n=1 Tax=Mesoterricola sediminis TaxID=2927980 RepID=A0AA48KHC2_9BACT|nr:diguanylate cyclase [Mesoterricola sediminis]BDU78233.1 hypothetical protein METESE_31910 [Mesoterricola sediminis]
MNAPVEERGPLLEPEAVALKARLEALRENPAFRSHPLMEELEALARDHLRLLRRMDKITRISDGFQIQLKELNDSLQVASRTDPLTGIPNRRAMLEALEAEHARTLRARGELCIVMADVDRFKHINDTFGHAAGDRVLHTLAQALRDALRGYDLCARWGGEEFLVLLPGTGRAGALEVADKLVRVAAGLELSSGSEAMPVSLSVGVAQLEPGENLDALLRRADGAMYEAKAAGGNGVRG